MSENMLIGIIRDSVYTGLLVSAPILIVSLVVGLLVSIFQASTQIQEQTLTFVPKLIAIAAVGILTGSWMLHTIVNFTTNIFAQIANIIQ